MKKKTNDKIIICLLLLFLPAVGVNAQEVNTFSPDSPGATTGPDIMP